MRERTLALVTLAAFGLAAAAGADVLTVDRAVELALQHGSQAINAEADVLQARGSLYGSYSGILPSVSASLSRSGSWVQKSHGSSFFLSRDIPTPLTDSENFSTAPTLSGSWSVLDLSALSDWRAAQNGMRSARSQRDATRNDVVLATKRQFYQVVTAVKLADVATGALKLARDDERRVRALFEVGSVSKSDLLKAQVRTAQSELDSLTAYQTVIAQRIVLAQQLGIAESTMGEVDTLLTLSGQPTDYDEARVLDEATRARPDLVAAEASLRASEASLRAANFRRLPFLSLSYGLTYKPRSNGKQTAYEDVDFTTGVVTPLDPPVVTASRSESDLTYRASIAVGMNIFNGFGTEGQIASARAGVMRARESRDALRRDLASQVHQAILDYRQAIERDRVATRGLESADENLKLTQQKYNVGSATILDLIDAQVQLERAQSDGVSARAAIRVAEAEIERVRGGGAH